MRKYNQNCHNDGKIKQFNRDGIIEKFIQNKYDNGKWDCGGHRCNGDISAGEQNHCKDNKADNARLEAGAVEFLTKPFRDQEILDAVQLSLKKDRERIENEKIAKGLKARFESLTSREREIMVLVTAGLMNKQIAGEIGVSEITVKVHRGNVMRKMNAKSLADLVRMAEALGVRRTK